ncbi:UNC-like C-terminal-domain-containing protein, partial [Trametes meyenii]
SYIHDAVTKALRDPVGLRDFALRAHGAAVLSELTSAHLTAPTSALKTLANSPDAVLDDDFRIGHCWSLPNGTGQLGVRLSEIIYPTHVTIDHIAAEVATDPGTAPQTMTLWGGVDGTTNEGRLSKINAEATTSSMGYEGPPVGLGYVYVALATFEYDIYSASTVQTFPLDKHITQSGMDFGIVVLEVKSNWGGKETCVYRLRVHGQPVRTA